jgi:hypothetical protein
LRPFSVIARTSWPKWRWNRRLLERERDIDESAAGANTSPRLGPSLSPPPSVARLWRRVSLRVEAAPQVQIRYEIVR